MSQYTALSRDAFAHKYWKAPEDYRFFSEHTVIPLGAHEATQAALHLPLAFTKQQDIYDLVAITGLRQNESLTVDLASGLWAVNYTPDLVSTYPFRAVIRPDSNDFVIVVNEASGLITTDANDLTFFQSNGEPSEPLAAIIQRLERLQHGRIASLELCKRLADADLLEPWNLGVKGEDGKVQHIEGLYRISEKAFNELGNVSFLSLRKHGALTLAYAQLFSMGNIHKLGRLGYLRQHLTQGGGSADAPAESADALFGEGKDDTLRFDF